MGAVNNMYAALWDYNNMPMELYPKIVKQIGTFVIPIFLVTNWQGMAILGKLSTFDLVWGAILPFLFFVVSRILWKKGIKKYISANG
jgi:ABC-2 type transport system permease protein